MSKQIKFEDIEKESGKDIKQIEKEAEEYEKYFRNLFIFFIISITIVFTTFIIYFISIYNKIQDLSNSNICSKFFVISYIFLILYFMVLIRFYFYNKKWFEYELENGEFIMVKKSNEEKKL